MSAFCVPWKQKQLIHRGQRCLLAGVRALPGLHGGFHPVGWTCPGILGWEHLEDLS